MVYLSQSLLGVRLYPMREIHLLAILATVFVAGSLLLSGREPVKVDRRILTAEQVDSTTDYSNILPKDYVGPESCADCHQEEYSLWKEHPHRCMNQLPNDQSVMADFEDAELELPSGKVQFRKQNDQFLMVLYQREYGEGERGELATEPHRTYYVTRTVGSRYMQYYVGKQLSGPESLDDNVYKEHMLPFAYGFRTKQWYPRQYFDADGDESLHHGVPKVEAMNGKASVRLYNEECMVCHNTMPYTYRIFNEKLVGFKDGVVAAAIVPLSEELRKEGLQVEPSAIGFQKVVRQLDPEKDLVTLGISCESCHLGGREHAEQERQISFLPQSKFVSILKKGNVPKLTNSRENAATILGTCTQCHSGGSHRFPNGGAMSNSSEALDMHGGFCVSEMTCVNCHEPHTAGQLSGGPDQVSHINSCITCHEQFSDETFATKHSGHPSSTEINCLDCHMPKITQGLQSIIRSHRIQNPVEESMIKVGSANACNLCHLDKTTEWTVGNTNRIWGTSFKLDSSWPIYKDRKKPVGDVWLESEVNHLRLMAAQSYGRTPFDELRKRRTVREKLIDSLNDPEALNRLFNSYSVREILGLERAAKMPVAITETPARRKEQIEQWKKRLQANEQ